MGALTVSPRRYLQNINGKSFEDCINFIVEQSAALGVTISPSQDIGSMLYAWAQYLSNEAAATEKVFDSAVAVVGAGSDPHDAFRKLQSLDNALQGKRSFMDSIKAMLGNNGMQELAATIESHPFYEAFQKEALMNGFNYVQEAYDAFKSIDQRVQKVKSGLGDIESKLNQLKEYDFGLDSIYIPGDITDNLAAAKAIGETRAILEQKPELFYSPTAAALLADASAKELHMLWKQSIVALDLAMSRWCCIAYFGLLLNASIKHVTAAQTFAHMIAANNDQLKQFGNLITAIASK